jgi:hypothetical protein
VLRGSAEKQPNRLFFQNINITGPGLWNVAVLIDGAALTGEGGLPAGVRSGSFVNMWLFNTKIAAVMIRSGVGLNFLGGGAFPGNGPVDGSGVWIIGTDQVPSTQIDFYAFVNNGVLNISKSSSVRYIGDMGSLVTDSSSRCTVIGQCGDASRNQLRQSSVILS